MKILMITESYWPNADGGALFERRLALGLVGLGHNVSVWAPGPNFKAADEIDGPYTIHREPGVTFLANRKYKVSFAPHAFWAARTWIRHERPDVIHIHNFYWMGLAGLFWAKRYHIPVVATNHFMPENALLNLKHVRFLYSPLERLIWAFLVWTHNHANVVTSPTPTAVQLLIDHGLRSPRTAISNGLDTTVFKPGHNTSALIKKYNLATDRPIMLYVGRLDGEKRLDLILKALPKIIDHQPVQLVLVGFGKAMDSLKTQALKLGIENDIVFTGYIDETEKPIIYNTARLFVISSPAELQSIVTLEAMASGLPIISVDVAALKELCHDGENGFLFPRDDSEALADRVNQLLANSALQSHFSAESIKIIHTLHDTHVTFNAYEATYNQARTLATIKKRSTT